MQGDDSWWQVKHAKRIGVCSELRLGWLSPSLLLLQLLLTQSSNSYAPQLMQNKPGKGQGKGLPCLHSIQASGGRRPCEDVEDRLLALLVINEQVVWLTECPMQQDDRQAEAQ